MAAASKPRRKSGSCIPFSTTATSGVFKRTFNDIVRETAESRKWHGFPADAVAIGSNGTGDLLILLPESVAAFGETLYAWQHDSGELIEVMNAR